MDSPDSSYRSTEPTVPPIQKWTVAGLRQALINNDIQFSRRLSKAELYARYVSTQSANLLPKSPPRKATSKSSKACKTVSSLCSTLPLSCTRSSTLRALGRHVKTSASSGRAPHTSESPSDSAQPSTAALVAAAAGLQRLFSAPQTFFSSSCPFSIFPFFLAVAFSSCSRR